MLLMLFSTVDYLDGYSNEDLVLNERQAADWISDKEGIIFSDRGPIYTWYLQKEINYTSNAFNGTILNSELINASADYYIGMEKVNLTDYSPVKEFGQVTIYQRNN